MTEEEKEYIIDETVERLKSYIRENLVVEVDGYYEPYSGQDDHYHHVMVELR
jgi:hypothetical protein